MLRLITAAAAAGIASAQRSVANAGQSCGGFMGTMCAAGLDCVSTMGPMIADGGGTCGAACPHGGQRDQWGNCIQAGCSSWFDGCNTCQVDSRGNCNSLSEVMCYQVVAGSAECRDASSTDGGHSTGRPGGGGADAGFNCCSGGSACGYTHCPALGAGQEGCVQPWAMPDGMTADTCKVAAPVSSAGPPEGCTTWFDGCNTCGRDTSDAPMMCTMMMCLQNGATECRGWAAGYGANAAHAGGARCSTTATRGNSRGTPCPAGLTCVITDPGHPEYDQPNSGVCQAAAAAVHHGNDACWSGRFDFDFCCDGATGNPACWGGQYTYAHCCSVGGGGH